MENKDLAEVEKKKTFFYGLGSDGSLIFQGEEPIPVNRGALAFLSPFFRDEFFGPEPKTEIEIQGFDRATFKLFLDCLLGLKEYTLSDALAIYPIVKEYKLTESKIKCVGALKPQITNENAPLVLNLSVCYEDSDLTGHVIYFIEREIGIINFLESQKYCSSLDPPAMCKLIESVYYLRNSEVWTLVYQWGEKYLKDRNKSNVKSFFMEIGILEKISLSHFESVAALIKFHETSKMQFFSNEEVFRLVQKYMLADPKMLPDNSDWVKIDPRDEFKELIVFRKYVPVNYTSSDQDLDIVIRPNYVLTESVASELSILKVKARYIYRLVNLRHMQKPDPTWRNDLHNFYREKLPDNPKAELCISPLFPSKEFDANVVDDDDTDDSDEETVWKFVVKTGQVAMDFHAIEITYRFKYSCRILKASLDTGKYSADKNSLYFTKNVTIAKRVNENKN